MFKLLIAFLVYAVVITSYAQPTEIIIRPGDVLKIEIPGEVDFENTFQVKRDGTLNLPEVGKVLIVGTSLQVYPVASLPDLSIKATDKIMVVPEKITPPIGYKLLRGLGSKIVPKVVENWVCKDSNIGI